MGNDPKARAHHSRARNRWHSLDGAVAEVLSPELDVEGSTTAPCRLFALLPWYQISIEERDLGFAAT